MPLNPQTLSLNKIINVTINLAPLPAPRATFNQELIVGTSTHIPSVGGSNPRIRVYEETAQMTADGFLDTDPEYIAAEKYFDQPMVPQFLWVGRQDLTALNTVIPNLANSGQQYTIGDIITVNQPGGGSLGTCVVETIGLGGAVTSLSPVIGVSGTGYSTGTAVPTTGGSGSGLEVDITQVGETLATALQVCRSVNYQWYIGAGSAINNGGVITPYSNADHLACAAWAQNAQPSSVYAATVCDDPNVLNGITPNILTELKALSYNRSMIQIDTTQNGLYPENIYSIHAILGYAMGANTGLVNTAYTLMFKGEVGIATAPLSETQVINICGIPGNNTGWNGNAYLSFGNFYNIFMQGVMSNGQFFDEIINLDMLSNDLQLNLMDLFYGTRKVPQTDAGASQEIAAANQACINALNRGFIAGGIYTGQPLLNLNTGAALPNGYLVQAPPYATQSPAQRATRNSVRLYVVILESGAVHAVQVNVNVQR